MTAATAEVAEVAPAKRGGRKKLIILIAAAALLLALVGGGAGYFLLKKKAADADDEDSDGHATSSQTHVEPRSGTPPVFSPLEPFTVNLADKDAERYAQVGVTLELDSTKTGDQIKTYMPAIRNNILMLLASKSAAELLSHEGKVTLAREIRGESLRALGIVVRDDAEPATANASGKKKGGKPAPSYPVRAVHFSNIIVQ